MRLSLLLIVLILGSISWNPAFGQLGWEWAYAEKCSLESQGTDVVQDSMGNIYVTGYFGGRTEFGDTVLNAVAYHDFFIAKLDPDRNLLWIRQGGSNSYNYANGIVLDDSLNVYITGSLNNSEVGFICKYDKEGTLKWEKTIGRGYHYEEKGKLITLAEDKIISACLASIWIINSDGSGLKVKMMYNTALSNFENGQFAAANDNEVVLLDKDLNQISSFPLPSGIELVHSVVLNDSDIYLTGRYTGHIVMGDSVFTGTHNMFITKMNATGQFIWANQGGGDTYDIGNALVINDSNQLFVAGSYRNVSTFDSVSLGQMGDFEEIFIAEYNIDNGRLADIINAGGGGDFDVAYGMTLSSDNQLLITGSLKDNYSGVSFGDIIVRSKTGNIDFFLAKTCRPELRANISGQVLKSSIPTSSWIKLYREDQEDGMQLVYNQMSDSEGKFNIDVFKSGNYLLKAHYYTESHMSTYYQDTYLWNQARVLVIAPDTLLYSLEIELIELPVLSGTNTISGQITDSEDEPKRFVDILLVSDINVPVSYARSDSAGVYKFENIPHGEFKILVDTAGLFMDSCYTVNTAALKSTSSEYSGYDYVIQEGLIYVTNSTSIQNISIQSGDVHIYPVPVREFMFVEFTGNETEDTHFDIIDLNGRLVHSQILARDKQINVSGLNRGTYLLRITCGHSIMYRKFVKLGE